MALSASASGFTAVEGLLRHMELKVESSWELKVESNWELKVENGELKRWRSFTREWLMVNCKWLMAFLYPPPPNLYPILERAVLFNHFFRLRDLTPYPFRSHFWNV